MSFSCIQIPYMIIRWPLIVVMIETLSICYHIMTVSCLWLLTISSQFWLLRSSESFMSTITIIVSLVKTHEFILFHPGSSKISYSYTFKLLCMHTCIYRMLMRGVSAQSDRVVFGQLLGMADYISLPLGTLSKACSS